MSDEQLLSLDKDYQQFRKFGNEERANTITGTESGAHIENSQSDKDQSGVQETRGSKNIGDEQSSIPDKGKSKLFKIYK